MHLFIVFRNKLNIQVSHSITQITLLINFNKIEDRSGIFGSNIYWYALKKLHFSLREQFRSPLKENFQSKTF